jgi:16S rRNA (guanine(966)-N(2))-methyltransferase RsmD
MQKTRSAKGKKRAATRAALPRSVATARATPQRVRIIGGRYKRTPIPVAEVAGLRPSPDRVRETLFNWLAHLRPDLATVRGLDLFAGTGALGFELASRGARQVTLVECNPLALRLLRALRERLGAPEVEIVTGEALAVAASLPPAGFELVFLDPPFASGLAAPALAAARRLLAPAGFVYFESGAALGEAEAGALGFDILRADRAGRVFFHLLRLRDV